MSNIDKLWTDPGLTCRKNAIHWQSQSTREYWESLTTALLKRNVENKILPVESEHSAQLHAYKKNGPRDSLSSIRQMFSAVFLTHAMTDWTAVTSACDGGACIPNSTQKGWVHILIRHLRFRAVPRRRRWLFYVTRSVSMITLIVMGVFRLRPKHSETDCGLCVCVCGTYRPTCSFVIKRLDVHSILSAVYLCCILT